MQNEVQQLVPKYVMKSTSAFWIILICPFPPVSLTNFTILCTTSVNSFEHMYQQYKIKFVAKIVISRFFSIILICHHAILQLVQISHFYYLLLSFVQIEFPLVKMVCRCSWFPFVRADFCLVTSSKRL